jgi:hypothetical protein
MKRGGCRTYAHPSLTIGRRIMGMLKPGDMISIKNPERHSLVKAGKLLLRSPDSMSVIVPEGLDRQDLTLIERLIEWNVIVVNEVAVRPSEEGDPLMAELINEYDLLNAREATTFLKGLSETNKQKFIDHEKGHKNRVTVLREFNS